MILFTILAAGAGKRMNSDLPKVLHNINNHSMLVHIINKIIPLNPMKIIVVVNKNHSLIKDELSKYEYIKVEFVVQDYPLGTGDAIKSTLDYLPDNCTNIILNGDCPLLETDTLKYIINSYNNNNHLLQITAIKLDNPNGNGRIIKNNQGVFTKIIEEKDCCDKEKAVKLINCGIYIANTNLLKQYIPLIKCENTQNEYYLTDIVSIYKQYGDVGLVELDQNKTKEIFNINTTEQLEEAKRLQIDSQVMPF